MPDDEKEPKDEHIEGETTMVTSLEDLYPNMGKQLVSKKAYLIVIAGNSVGEMYQIRKEEIHIGRDRTSDIIITDVGISRGHARIFHDAGGDLCIEDLKSTNGTFVNGDEVQKRVLIDGDRIQFGRTTILKFSLSDDLEESFQRRMYDSAVRDGLTRIYNRQYFEERLASEFSYAYRHFIPLSIIMMDLDHFKSVNDTFGHPVGDVVLKTVASTITRTIRTEDMLSRYGGEEFVILARNTDAQSVHILAERIRSSMEEQIVPLSSGVIKVTLSAGTSTLENRNVGTPEELVAAADEALYHAKRMGRNRCVQATTG
ncbi:MAG: GGDEF domain-containing protein [Deltaproteobacteria bacterium]|nr:GGDEF domain-containing protein [Deltaproteobacteria bacterium]